MIRIFKLLKLQCAEFPVLMAFLITCVSWIIGRTTFLSFKSINIWILVPVQWIYFRPLLMFSLQDRIGFFVHPLNGFERIVSILAPYVLFLITVFTQSVVLGDWMFFIANSLVAGGDILNRILALFFLSNGSGNCLFHWIKKRPGIMAHKD